MATKKAAKKAAAAPARKRAKQAEPEDEEDVLEPDEEEGFGEGTEEDEEPNDPTDDIEEQLDEEGDEEDVDDEDEDEDDVEDFDTSDLDDDEEVVVVKKVPRKQKNPLHVWPLRVRDRNVLKNSRVVRVKARRMGYYGDKRRRIGEVFDMRLSGGTADQLPKWVVSLKKAKPAENEGSRGISTGNQMADEHMRQRRGVREGLTNRKIKDKTIIDDALPLGQGGNARKPRGRGEDTVL